MSTTEDKTAAPALPPPAPAPDSGRPRRRLPGLLLWLLLLLLIACVGLAGWRVWLFRIEVLETVEGQERLLHRIERDVAGVRSELEQTAGRSDDLTQAQRRVGVDLAGALARLEETEQAMTRLQDSVQGGRLRFQVLAVEQLLLAANDQLLLARDIGGAMRALELAESRLAALSEPRLYQVREAIAAERAELATLPVLDTGTISLSLGALIGRADTLTLAAQLPERFEASRSGDEPRAAEGAWHQRLWGAVRAALAHVFVLRRDDQQIARLLPPEQEALIRQLLLLRLESARFALLRGDSPAFRDSALQADAWLAQYYRAEDGGVQAAREELRRLAQQKFATRLPEISRSLALLRGYLQAAPR